MQSITAGSVGGSQGWNRINAIWQQPHAYASANKVSSQLCIALQERQPETATFDIDIVWPSPHLRCGLQRFCSLGDLRLGRSGLCHGRNRERHWCCGGWCCTGRCLLGICTRQFLQVGDADCCWRCVGVKRRFFESRNEGVWRYHLLERSFRFATHLPHPLRRLPALPGTGSGAGAFPSEERQRLAPKGRQLDTCLWNPCYLSL